MSRVIMDLEAASKWCEQHRGKPELCVILSLPGGEWVETRVRQVVTTLSPDNRGFVLDCIEDPSGPRTHALLEWRDVIPPCFQNPKITLSEGIEADIITPRRLPDSPVVGASEPTGSQTASAPEMPTPGGGAQTSFFDAFQTLIERCLKIPTAPPGYGYRKLRFFSGKVPIPSGEEDFETWMDQATQALEEWDVPEIQKKQRITESLRGPAADVIRNLKLTQEGCKASDYIEALYSVYGRVEKLSDLMYKFEHTHQRRGERLSEYIVRVDKILHQILQKKGIEPQTADKVRLTQVLHGARPNHPIVLKFLLKGPRDPPTYPNFLKEVREEEALLEEKNQNGSTTPKSAAKIEKVQTHPMQVLETASDYEEEDCISDSGGEYPEKNRVSETQPFPGMPEFFAQLVQNQVSVQQSLHDVQTIVAQVVQAQSEMQKAVVALTTKETSSAEALAPVNEGMSQGKCYRCGEVGHFRARCPKGKPSSQVIEAVRKVLEGMQLKPSEKLQRTPVKEPAEGPLFSVRSNVNSGNNKERPSKTNVSVSDSTTRRGNAHQSSKGSGNSPPELRRKKTKKRIHVQPTGSTASKATRNPPSELVGPSPVVPVQVEGIYTKALLDSGAQVTLLYRDFYDKYLKHLPLQKLENLEIWGIGTGKFPYDGYIQIKLTVDPLIAGQPGTFDTLAIVCPRPPGSERSSLIVGTNTDLVRRMLVPIISRKDLPSGKVHPLLRSVYHRLVQEEKAPAEDVGKLWLLGRKEKILQPGEVACLRAEVRLSWKEPGPYIMLETASNNKLSGMELVPEVVPTKDLQRVRGKVPVSVRNPTDSPVRLRARMLLGEVKPVTPVAPLPSVGEAATEPCEEQFYPEASPAPPEWKERIQRILSERKDLFSRDEFDVGCAESVQHRIRLTDDRPFRERSRRIPLADFDDLREQIGELKRTGVISDSRSPYASPIVVVRKKNGSLRLCIDYRTLNRRTIPDQYTTPRIEDALQCLTGAKWFSVLDLRSGYHQIPMHPDDQEKTAFICPVGFYQFNRMPQGLAGAPATFQRLMEKTVGDMHLLEVLVYLDDLIVFGRTLEEHEQRLVKVLDRLKGEGLKLSLDKCQFCRPSVNYLGHVVSAEGVATDPAKLEAVTSWPRPRTVEELRSFLGFCSYYRRFVEGFAKIARPLNELLKNEMKEGELPSTASKSHERGPRKSKENIQSEWNDACEKTFNRLKWSLTNAPVLAYADPTQPYELHVDACREGIGGVLYQKQDGKLRPVAYVSRSLSATERNYPTHKLEFLALKWSVVDKLRDYLYGAKFEVKTDNNPLTYILTTAKLDATGHRWLAALSEFDFSLKYRPGATNRDADALSRRPHATDDRWARLGPEEVQTIYQGVDWQVKGSAGAQVVGVMAAGVPELYCDLVQLRQENLPNLSRQDLKKDQQEDPLCQLVLRALESNDPKLLWTDTIDKAKLVHKEWPRLLLSGGLVYRKIPSEDSQDKLQLFLPEKHHHTVLTALHDDHGHLGTEKTFQLVRDRFYWPCMRAETESYCRSCLRCIQRKVLPSRAAPMGHLQSQSPMELVCMDFLCLESDTSGQGNILVVTDHFTRYAQAFPTKDQRASTVAKVLVEKYFVHYGLPQRIHSDQGRDFESKLIKELMRMLGVAKSRTTPYHPQGDPQPERFNRTLLDMLGTLSSEHKQHWSRFVSALVHAYNSTRHDSTGYSPYRLMFGREARLPVDVAFGISLDGTSAATHHNYVKRLRQDLKVAYEKAQAASENRGSQNKKRYDLRVRIHDLKPGDRVLLRNLSQRGLQKLADRWSSQQYIICSQLPGLPVYQIRPEGRTGPLKTWHRNHLLPLSEAVRTSPPEEPKPQRQRPITRSRSGAQNSQSREDTVEDDESDEDMVTDWLWTQVPMDYHSSEPEPRSDSLRAEAPEFVPHVANESMAPEAPIRLSGEPSFEPPPTITCPSAESLEAPTELITTLQSEPAEAREKRPIRPPKRLTYDSSGNSTEEVVTTVHRRLKAKEKPAYDDKAHSSGSWSNTPWWAVPLRGDFLIPCRC